MEHKSILIDIQWLGKHIRTSKRVRAEARRGIQWLGKHIRTSKRVRAEARRGEARRAKPLPSQQEAGSRIAATSALLPAHTVSDWTLMYCSISRNGECTRCTIWPYVTVREYVEKTGAFLPGIFDMLLGGAQNDLVASFHDNLTLYSTLLLYASTIVYMYECPWSFYMTSAHL